VHEDLADIPGIDRALAFLREAYQTRLTRKGRTIEHPIAVARLLAEDGWPPSLVLTGLLHDVLEDTQVTRSEVEAGFGTGIARSMSALTQDPSIRKYRKRKAALRERILDAGPDIATVSLADKLAKLRSLDSRPAERALDHYRETLTGIERRYGRSRLSDLLREQLDRWPQS
jgi:GTP pyrophosphokinase